jgi:hypothetical protein
MLLREAAQELEEWVVPVEKIEEALMEGKYYFPKSCTGEFC